MSQGRARAEAGCLRMFSFANKAFCEIGLVLRLGVGCVITAWFLPAADSGTRRDFCSAWFNEQITLSVWSKPTIECDLPEPVCPYAKRLTL